MPKTKQRGFTLIELMIVVSIIGILTLIGVPHFRAYVLEARLKNALPMLTQIAAKMRMQMLERGVYCCELDPTVEANIATETGIPLEDEGDFCFMIICKDATMCPVVTTANFISPAEAGDAPPEFEVWAVLRDSTAATISVPGDACTPDIGKRPPTGWVQPGASGSAGREGQVVALRYPPPVNGTDTTTGEGGHRYSWEAGLSKTHAQFP